MLYRKLKIVTEEVCVHNSMSAHSRLGCHERITSYRKIHWMKFCASKWWIWLGNSKATTRIWALLNEKIVPGCFKLLSWNRMMNFNLLACAFFIVQNFTLQQQLRWCSIRNLLFLWHRKEAYGKIKSISLL